MNKVILMGRLTRDPETRYSQAAEPVAIVRFGIAVSRRFKQPNEPDVDFFDCVAFRKTGEFIGKYFNKGRMIAVTGQLRNNNWEDQSGQKRFKTEVIVDDAFFTESKSAAEASGFNTQSQNTSQPPQSNQNQSFYSIDQNIDDEDLPF